jgi:uncharacterized protein YndB with AHSA1/START domain
VVEVSRIIRTGPERVFAVLADGWSYASWVVGADHIREVDDAWPGVGARVHHQVGPWPLHIKDQTSVRVVRPDRLQFPKPRNTDALRRLDDLAVHRG